MSKYHERAAAIERVWTTPEGITASLQGVLELGGYGTGFQVFRGGMPIDEEAARQAIIDEVTAPPLIEKYQRTLQAMVDDGSIKGWAVYVEPDPAGGLVFRHGDFEPSLSLGEFEVVTGAKEVEQRRKRRNKTQTTKEDRVQKLKDKLDETQDTEKDDYLLHAIQCGYLIRNTAIRFFAQIEGQLGCSTETKIQGITLPKLRDFIDSAGRTSLAEVSTHVDTGLEKTAECGGGKKAKADVVEAVHSGFAEEIIDFLNLEYEVDVDSIKRRHREEKADSGFRSIGHWIEQSGGDGGMVLEKLKDRRRNLDPDEIAAAFELGYEATEM